MTAPGAGPVASGLRGLPRAIWALGLVSLFMDVSSEMIHSLLPVYLVGVMGASALTVGVIEGVAEATASITKIFSGAISDWVGQRKVLAVVGYGLAAFTKPMFPLANSVGWLVTARFVDRVGKGIRGAPRDALVADLAPPGMRGAAFGLRQSLDTVGAFLGPALAILLMWLTLDNYRIVFWVAILPAFLSVAMLVFGVREPERPIGLRKVRAPLSLGELSKMGPAFWWITALATVFTLARFSEAFLILRAQQAGLAIVLVPLVLIVMNITYALAAYPLGALSDRVNKVTVLMAGIVVLIAADLVLAIGDTVGVVGVGVVLWGLHMGFTQGLLASLVAETSPPELRGTGFGVFNMFGGVALLMASIVAGYLWDAAGPATTFLAGAGIAVLTLAALVAVRLRMPLLGAVREGGLGA